MTKCFLDSKYTVKCNACYCIISPMIVVDFSFSHKEIYFSGNVIQVSGQNLVSEPPPLVTTSSLAADTKSKTNKAYWELERYYTGDRRASLLCGESLSRAYKAVWWGVFKKYPTKNFMYSLCSRNNSNVHSSHNELAC